MMIVGAYVTDGTVSQAMLWKDGVTYLIADAMNAGALVKVTNATEITDDGFVYAEGSAFGSLYGFILTPIPEPSAIFLLPLVLLLRNRYRGRGLSSVA